MNTKREIPKQFQSIFNTWEEYREWCIEKSKVELEKAFEKNERNRGFHL